MDTNREKSNLESGSIRLRYSTQFSSGGRTQNIDTEISLPVGASQETREQIIREAELGVEQLMRQIAQRGNRSAQGGRAAEPTALRPGSATSTPSLTRPVTTTRSQSEPAPAPRQATNASLPATRAPVGESMPTTATAGGEGKTIRLADFINAIKRRWNMSPKEAMDLLGVDALDGLNYRDIYRQLEEIIKKKNPAPPEGQTRTSPGAPIIEAPRSSGGSRGTPPPAPRSPLNAATSSMPGTQGQTALKQSAKVAPQTIPIPSEPSANTQAENETQTSRPQAGRDFAGSSKAPIPLHIGVGTVREASTQAYKFDEEEEENEGDYEVPGDDEEQARLSAQIKLDELKTIRGTSAASAERLTVLNNVLSSQISEDQLQKILQAAWSVTNKKKLKAAQVEALVSWAKEDFFTEEVEAMLDLLEEGEV